MSESSWQTLKGNLHIGHGVKYNHFYPLTLYSHEGSLNVVKMPTSSLWHGRLRHISQIELERFSTLGYIPKLQHSESNFSVNTGSRPEAGTRLSMRGYTLTLRANSQRYLRIDA